jgi:hypothetical protein
LKILKKRLLEMATDSKYEARIAELERLLGQAHAENELLKKAFIFWKKSIED